MGLLKVSLRFVTNNSYLLFGIFIGTFISMNFTDFSCETATDATDPYPILSAASTDSNWTRQVVIKHNATRKAAQKSKEAKPVRPRYYSTELGIKEKLFIGILSSEEKVHAQAAHINRTVEHLADKVKVFITAQQHMQSKFNLSGIVGFTDTRHVYRPFQVVKYIGDSFIQDYDYYFLVHDHNYVNARRLREIVEKISVSLHVYLGAAVKDGSYCDIDAGILLSNSVLRAMIDNLDWCVRNAVSDDHSENVGRCVHHSTKLTCQAVVQGQSLSGYKLKQFELDKYLETLSRVPEFREAVTVYPILQKNDFYLLHAYFCRQQLAELRSKIVDLSAELSGSWPPGQRTASKPATRFDLASKYYFNRTHMFFPDDFTNIRPHTSADAEDIERVIGAVVAKVLNEKPDDFQFSRLLNGYRAFDLSRGLDYQIDLAFRDLHTGKEVVKRFEVCKPLGQVEFIAKPYTTENGKVTVLVPVQQGEVGRGLAFLDEFESAVMERREKVLLMLVFLYQYDAPSKGNEDVYKSLKDRALKVSSKYHNEDTKVAWVSIRLPSASKPISIRDCGALNFAVVDLALRKIGLDNLILILDIYSEITVEFLNRIRMNTISEYQIFSAIPFRQYDPEVTNIETLEVHKNTGHFDREEYKFVSFYARDYVQVRKKFNSRLPIIRADNNITMILQDEYKDIGNVFEMFLTYSDSLHCMRATEPSLKVRYHQETDEKRSNLFLGNKAQLAKIILDYQNKIM